MERPFGLSPSEVRVVQQALRDRGFIVANGKPLAVDGDFGDNTSAAVIAYKKSKGLKARDYVGPITYAMLTEGELKVPAAAETNGPPWYNEMLTIMGLHESRNYSAVKEWLDEDGIKLGDQRRIPWCGAAVSSALNNAGFKRSHPSNPNAAINWREYGIATTPRLGAIMVQHRGDPKDWRGHIGFYAGESNTHYYLLGGNQGDSVNITPFSKRLLRANGCRWPQEGPKPDGYGKVYRSGGKTTKVT